MKILTVLGAIVVAVLFFFSIIFAISSSVAYTSTRLIVAVLLFVVGVAAAYYMTKKTKKIIQRVELSGEMKAVALGCPNCSASIDANQIKIVSGVPYATCKYCGHTFEVVEEPKW